MTKLRQKDRELDTIKNKLKFILNLHGTHYFLPKDENVVVDNLLSYGTADKFLTMSTEFDKTSSKSPLITKITLKIFLNIFHRSY